MGVQRISFNYNPVAVVSGLASIIKSKAKNGWILNLADLTSSELLVRDAYVDLASMGENGISEDLDTFPKAGELLAVFSNAMGFAASSDMAISNMWAMYIPPKKISGYVLQTASSYVFPVVTGVHSYFMADLGETVIPMVAGAAYEATGKFSLLNGNMEQPTIVMGVTLREIHS